MHINIQNTQKYKQKMSSNDSKNIQNQADRQNQKKRARRTRKDEDGRDFICMCGKSYLSYPALYTHIKTKHDGKVTIVGKQVPQKLVEEEDRTIIKQDLQPLKIILTKFYPERLRQTPISQLAPIFSEQQRQYIMPLLQFWENDQKMQKTNSQKKPYPSARQVFGKFIFDMNKRINPASIKFLTKLMMYIHNGVCKQKKSQKYCDECTASLVPSLFNELIINGHIPIDKQSSEKVLQQNQTVCKIMMYFCNWLFNQKYTNYSVKYKL